MKYRLSNFEDGFEVESLEQYWGIINRLNNTKEEGTSIFFRGQEADCWEIEPSIFRDNLLSVEHILMEEPLRQVPQEFNGLRDNFEIMTKYQHYGMCTRLLDLTTNPLVALFFACAEHEEEIYIDEEQQEVRRKPHGVVFFKKAQSVMVPQNMRVQLISAMTRYDMNGGMAIQELLQRLEDDKVIGTENRKKWLTKEGIEEFVKIVQKSYLVSPVLSNERLIRQSGIFMLPGRFNFSFSTVETVEGIIEKSRCDLKDEFEREYIYVSSDNKKRIRKELDSCNINEANLFPELEHQLLYIRQINSLKVRTVNRFERYQTTAKGETDTKDINEKQAYEMIVSAIRNSFTDKELTENIIGIVRDSMIIDWYKRESVLSSMRRRILVELIKFGTAEKEGRILAEKLVSTIRNIWVHEKIEG